MVMAHWMTLPVAMATLPVVWQTAAASTLLSLGKR